MIFGANASGKSSISRAIRLLAQTIPYFELSSERVLDFSYQGSLVDLGTAEQTIFGQNRSDYFDRSGPQKIEESALGVHTVIRRDDHTVGFSLVNTVLLENTLPAGIYSIVWAKDRELLLSLVFIRRTAEEVTATLSAPEEGSIFLDIAESIGELIGDCDENEVRRVCTSPISLKIEVSEFQANAGLLSSFVRALLDALENHFGFVEDQHPGYPDLSGLLNLLISASELLSKMPNIRHVGPVRTIPQRIAHGFESNFVEFGSEQKVNEWLSRLTEDRYNLLTTVNPLEVDIYGESVHVDTVWTHHILDNYSRAVVGFENVGVGLSHLIPIIQSAFPVDDQDQKGLVLIEQPELHLHPRLQAELGNLFAEAYLQNRDRQFVIETHSESLLLRIQKLVRNGTLRSEDVSIVYTEGFVPDPNDPSNNVRHNIVYNLELENSGDLVDPLPTSFAHLRVQELLD